jgi:hypothetical protein
VPLPLYRFPSRSVPKSGADFYNLSPEGTPPTADTVNEDCYGDNTRSRPSSLS